MLVKYKAVENPKPITLQAQCVDLRFAQASEEFCEKLGISRHRDIKMSIGGGLTPLAYPAEMPSKFKYVRKQLEFKCRKFPSIERIVVIVHQDCGYYKDQVPTGVLKGYYCSNATRNTDGIERRDAPLIASFLEVLFPEKKVEVYHARLIDDNRHIVYEPVPCGPKESAILGLDQWVKQAQRVLHS